MASVAPHRASDAHFFPPMFASLDASTTASSRVFTAQHQYQHQPYQPAHHQQQYCDYPPHHTPTLESYSMDSSAARRPCTTNDALAQAILSCDLAALERLLQATPILPAPPTAPACMLPNAHLVEPTTDATATLQEAPAEAVVPWLPPASDHSGAQAIVPVASEAAAQPDSSSSPAPVARGKSASSSPLVPQQTRRRRTQSAAAIPVRSAPVRAAAARATSVLSDECAYEDDDEDDQGSQSNTKPSSGHGTRAKRKYCRQKPVPADFDSEEDFQVAFQAWRHHRDRNNKAVRKSRSLKKDPDALSEDM